MNDRDQLVLERQMFYGALSNPTTEEIIAQSEADVSAAAGDSGPTKREKTLTTIQDITGLLTGLFKPKQPAPPPSTTSFAPSGSSYVPVAPSSDLPTYIALGVGVVVVLGGGFMLYRMATRD